MNLLTSETLNHIIDVLNFKEDSAEVFEDTLLSAYNSYVHVLDEQKPSILETDSSLKPDDLYYSAYYWFTQFKSRHFELFGHDEGLEQQGFIILENISMSLEEIDWSIIEVIEKGNRAKSY